MIDEQIQSGSAANERDGLGDSSEPKTPEAPIGRWLDEHGDVLWRFVLGRVRTPDVAEEVVQETVLAALQGWSSFSGDSTERTWLLGIAAHKIADHFRAVRRRATNAGGIDEASAGKSHGDSAGDFDDAGRWAECPGKLGLAGGSGGKSSEHAETLAALRRCLNLLPPSLGEAVWLRDLLGLPASEVCKAMGITPTNLWSRMHRARSALRRCVEQRIGTGKEGSR